MKALKTLTVNGEIYQIINDSELGMIAWSSKNTVDKLCPSFEERGSVVKCEPIEGYPLKVVTELTEGVNRITLFQCGKNLFDYTKYTFENNLVYDTSGSFNSSSGYRAFKEYMPIGHLKGQTITLNHPGAEKDKNTHAALCFYDADKVYISGSNGYTHIVPDNAEYIRFSVPKECVDGTWSTVEDIQIELGGAVTECVPYREPVQYTVDLPELVDGRYEWSDIKAISGVNSLWADSGKITVSGKADPVAIIEKLTNAILSLGGNI